MDFVVLHATFFEIGVGEIEQCISTEHATYRSIENVRRFVSECFGCIHILYQMKTELLWSNDLKFLKSK